VFQFLSHYYITFICIQGFLKWVNLNGTFPQKHKVKTLNKKSWRFQNHEFDHTQGEIQKKPAKKYISIQQGMKLRKPSILVVNRVSSCLSFFLSASTAAASVEQPVRDR